MSTELEGKEIKAVEFTVSHCEHPRTPDRSAYSLDVNIEDCHVNITASGYDHQPGFYTRIGIYNLQVSDIKALGEAIITEALTIKMKQAETPA